MAMMDIKHMLMWRSGVLQTQGTETRILDIEEYFSTTDKKEKSISVIGRSIELHPQAWIALLKYYLIEPNRVAEKNEQLRQACFETARKTTTVEEFKRINEFLYNGSDSVRRYCMYKANCVYLEQKGHSTGQALKDKTATKQVGV